MRFWNSIKEFFMIEINFIPWRKNLRQQHFRYFLLRLLGGILIIILATIIRASSNEHPKDHSETVISDITNEPKISIEEKCKNRNCIFKNYPISELIMVGSLIGEKQKWAFITTRGNLITKVQIGDFLGNKLLRVEKIDSSKIELVELSSDKKQNKHKIIRLRTEAP